MRLLACKVHWSSVPLRIDAQCAILAGMLARVSAQAVPNASKPADSARGAQECMDGKDVATVSSGKRVLRVIKILRILKIMRLLKGIKLVE